MVPVDAGIWEVDCDDASTITTEANWRSAVGNNVDHRLSGASGDLYATPRLDISTVNTTSTLIWNIVGLSPTVDNFDLAGNYVKLLVRANVCQLRAPAAGIAGI